MSAQQTYGPRFMACDWPSAPCSCGQHPLPPPGAEPVPDLDLLPVCPLCGRPVSGDDVHYWCDHCALSWNLDGTGGERE